MKAKYDEIQHDFVCIIQVKGRNKEPHNEEIIIFYCNVKYCEQINIKC